MPRERSTSAASAPDTPAPTIATRGDAIRSGSKQEADTRRAPANRFETLSPSDEEMLFGSRVVGAVACTALAVSVKYVPEKLAPAPGVESHLMFDGVCNLCDGFVNFVAEHDSGRRVRFGAQQKHMEMLERIGAPTDLSTLVLIQGDRFYVQSAAALRTMAVLDWPFRALSVLSLVPSPLRDLGYRFVARHRYRVFGERESCRVPTGDFKSRFLDYVPDAADPISGETK